MKTYRGYRRMEKDWQGKPTTCTCIVMVETGKRQRALRPRLDIRSHSPTGFEWGYGGSGPAQLALALVADALGRRWTIPAIYQRVKELLIAGLPHDGWALTESEILAAALTAKEEIRDSDVRRALEQSRKGMQSSEGGGHDI